MKIYTREVLAYHDYVSEATFLTPASLCLHNREYICYSSFQTYIQKIGLVSAKANGIDKARRWQKTEAKTQ